MFEDWNNEAHTRINTWRKIASYLGEEVDVARAWAQDRGMPVHYWPDRQHGGAFAYTADLDRWMRDELVRADLLEQESLDSREQRSVHVSSLACNTAATLVGLAEHAPAGPAPYHDVATEPQLRSDVTAVAAAHGAQREGTRQFLWASAAGFFAVLTAALLHTVGQMHREPMSAANRRAPGLTMATFDRTRPLPPARINGAGSGELAMSHKSADQDAVEAYLEGRFLWSLRTPESLSKAKLRFAEAIRLDPDYAQAYAGLADCFLLLRQYGPMPSSSAFPQAAIAARKALELDVHSAEAHRSLAFVLSYWAWDMNAAEREFRQAIALNPADADAHHWYATSLMNRARFDEALTQIDIARSLDPSSRSIAANRGLILLLLGDHNRGVAALKALIATDPEFSPPHAYLAEEHLRRSECASFLAEEEIFAQLRHKPELLVELRAARRALQQGGRLTMLRTLARAAADDADRGGDAFQAALYGIRAQDREAALHYLKISHDRHEPNFLSVVDASDFASLRSDPAFQALRAMADVHT